MYWNVVRLLSDCRRRAAHFHAFMCNLKFPRENAWKKKKKKKKNRVECVCPPSELVARCSRCSNVVSSSTRARFHQLVQTREKRCFLRRSKMVCFFEERFKCCLPEEFERTTIEIVRPNKGETLETSTLSAVLLIDERETRDLGFQCDERRGEGDTSGKNLINPTRIAGNTSITEYLVSRWRTNSLVRHCCARVYRYDIRSSHVAEMRGK